MLTRKIAPCLKMIMLQSELTVCKWNFASTIPTVYHTNLMLIIVH